MSKKDHLADSLQKNPETKKRGFFSKAYHRYFHGYSEIVVPNSHGKGTRIERIYTGDYYRQDLDHRKRICVRVAYVVLFVCSVLLFILGAIYPHPINTTLYVTIPQAISVGFLFWIFVIFYNYLPAPKQMTISEYLRSSRYLLAATIGATFALLTLALASTIFIFLNPFEERLRLLLCILEYFLAASFTFGIYLIEKKIKYIQYPNPNKPPEDSYKID